MTLTTKSIDFFFFFSLTTAMNDVHILYVTRVSCENDNTVIYRFGVKNENNNNVLQVVLSQISHFGFSFIYFFKALIICKLAFLGGTIIDMALRSW